MKMAVVHLFALVVCTLSACTTTKTSIHFPLEIGVRPESITRAFDGDFFVTVMNEKIPGDGVVVRLSQSGDMSTFASGFDEPKGIAYVGNHLYLSDLQRVWRIDQNGKATVFADASTLPFEPLYLNDVAAAPDNSGIYVTDMGATQNMRDSSGRMWPLDSPEAKKMPLLGRVYFISLQGEAAQIYGPSSLMPNPNGVGITNKLQVMVTGFFTGNVLVPDKNGALYALPGVFRGADAIEQDSQGHYYVSSWSQGKVWRIDGETGEAKVLSEGHRSAADFYLDEANDRLLLPDMLSGTVIEVSLTP